MSLRDEIPESLLERARAAVAPHVRRTPILASGTPGAVFKAECRQVTGSFKVRGPLVKFAGLSPAGRDRGFVTASAGNHALGAAWAARACGVRLSIVVPEGTPEVKRGKLAEMGVEPIVSGDGFDAAEVRARTLALERGAPYLSPFDDLEIMAGNGGTLALEILEDVPALARLVVPVGGGGLLGGVAAAILHRKPGVEIVGVQSAACPAMADSFARGAAIEACPASEPTVAEGLEGGVAARTYRFAREVLREVRLVSERAIRRAIAEFDERHGLAVEGSGAVTLAALREGLLGDPPPRGGATVLLLTGGNVDPARVRACRAESRS